MKTLDNYNLDLTSQVREFANLEINKTGRKQSDRLFFVQLDNNHSVGSDGCIYQFISEKSIPEDCNPILAYKSENGNLYNYAEDSADFIEDSEELEIFSNCLQQAELLADE